MIDNSTRAFYRKWGFKTPVEVALRSAFPDLQRMPVPIDLRFLARQRNVVSINNLPMSVDGTISLNEDGYYSIELNNAHSMLRRRFTCAHEIGHTFFMELDENPTGRMRVVDDDLQHLIENRDEELWCNVIAAEILMPYVSFGNMLRKTGISASSIVSLSRSFRTSLWSTARRVVERSPSELGVNLVAALWQYQAHLEGYSTMWLERSPSLRGKLSSLFVHKQTPAYFNFHHKESFRGRTWLPLGGPISDYFIDLLVFKDSGPRRVLTVVVFDKYGERALNEISASSERYEQLSFLGDEFSLETTSQF